jgi:hypothetical protein
MKENDDSKQHARQKAKMKSAPVIQHLVLWDHSIQLRNFQLAPKVKLPAVATEPSANLKTRLVLEHANQESHDFPCKILHVHD